MEVRFICPSPDKLQERGDPAISMVYKAVWEQQYLDLTELARLYWVENW